MVKLFTLITSSILVNVVAKLCNVSLQTVIILYVAPMHLSCMIH
jgi:hypothetical protein